MKSGCTILVLNGPPSSGKTTLCKKLVDQLHFPFLHFSIDTFYGGLTQKPFSSLQRACLPNIYNGFLASIQAYANEGNGVLLDMVLTNPSMKNALLQYLDPHSTHLIGLYCPLEILKTRNLNRNESRRLMTHGRSNASHDTMLYDLKINTAAYSLVQCSDQVIHYLNTPQPPKALKAMREIHADTF